LLKQSKSFNLKVKNSQTSSPGTKNSGKKGKKRTTRDSSYPTSNANPQTGGESTCKIWLILI
jgi:hypothetical protein